ncbi:hypothetical protein SAMN05444380_104111 [Thermophagus xiamenensis]|uniref:Uncharacterized protein n=1 Tax=Thermophagus xiamenensis TaxID=385682 RepID=A0A1I1WHU5_9BACT|nr:hypothetical protein SAMN05444380_104111 [Thermophagus xiamenensis]
MDLLKEQIILTPILDVLLQEDKKIGKKIISSNY